MEIATLPFLNKQTIILTTSIMEQIRVNIEWYDHNFGASLGDNVPGAVVLTAKTYDELMKEIPETLRFHVEGMVADGDDVPQWLRDGDYTFD